MCDRVAATEIQRGCGRAFPGLNIDTWAPIFVRRDEFSGLYQGTMAVLISVLRFIKFSKTRFSS
jgi:hypothetical protein